VSDEYLQAVRTGAARSEVFSLNSTVRGNGVEPGVEFIEIAEVWDAASGGKQPILEGHLLNLVSGPNRYALPVFYEIHVWAWERNPQGSFADWNTQVSCERQPLE
jgi:hypothetical protein